MYICRDLLESSFGQAAIMGGKRSDVLGNETSFNRFADAELFRCDSEAGIPKLLYPHTKFPNDYYTPIHDSLVQGYNIHVVD